MFAYGVTSSGKTHTMHVSGFFLCIKVGGLNDGDEDANMLSMNNRWQSF